MRSLAFCALLAAACSSLAWASDEVLSVAQDPDSMLRSIMHCLREHHQIYAPQCELRATKYGPELDVWADKGSATGPEAVIGIATETDEHWAVCARRVCLVLRTGCEVPSGREAAVLEVINRHQAAEYFVLDADLEIAWPELRLQWFLYVLGDPLPTEYVWDMIARVQTAWQGLEPEVEKAIHGDR
jgi:hypothetical protein